MQLIATTVLALFGVASALPSNKPLQARAGFTVTFYPEANFGGVPVTATDIPNSQCQTVPAEIAGLVGSVQVAPGALCRLTYTEATCSNHGDIFVFPDEPATDLHNFVDGTTGEVVDAGTTFKSYLCQECTGC